MSLAGSLFGDKKGWLAPSGWPEWSRHIESAVAIGSLLAVGLFLILRHLIGISGWIADAPLILVLLLGGGALLYNLAAKLLRREIGADLLAGISIVTAVVLGEYLAGTLVVMMLAGGGALERYAVGKATAVLDALARRAPSIAHHRRGDLLEGIAVSEVRVGEILAVFPHEVCPVDGVVLEGHGAMDESYLTGEPFVISKAPGAPVLSGAVNGSSVLTIRALRPAEDSRYAKIMRVVRDAEQKKPELRRLGDRLGAGYAPLALAAALAAWLATGDPVRFLAVLVVATPCPLIIAIPVAIIGAISLAAKRSIVIRDPACLERIQTVRTIILDKTGTLTFGTPKLTERQVVKGEDDRQILGLVASLEQYSKHPLASAILEAAREAAAPLKEGSEVREDPGQGLRGKIEGDEVVIGSRRAVMELDPGAAALLPPAAAGLECSVAVNGRYVATYRFRDAPRRESGPFVAHLGKRHGVTRVLLVSGDRKSEVGYLAGQVGIDETYAEQSPEEKVAIVSEETRRVPTLFIGDGINDAPALLVATVGVAFGRESDVTAQAAGAVIMEASLRHLDELFHIGRRMRRIALQSAVGGMALSIIGMSLAAAGLLAPVEGAIVQEAIDLAAILNAIRVALPKEGLSDF